MKTLFDTDARYARAVVSGVIWKLEGGFAFYRYPGDRWWTPRMGAAYKDERVFNSWIASGLVKEIPSEDVV